MKDHPSQWIASGLCCRDVSDCASDYLDDRLPFLSKMQTGLHLASCADCRAYFRQMALIQDVVPRLPRQLPSRIVGIRLRQQFRMRHVR